LRIARFIPKLKPVVVVITPEIFISTKQARGTLPRQVPLTDAVRNWANASSLILALMTEDVDLLTHCLEDRVAEPRRGELIPGYDEAKRAAMDAGAWGASISGSGPTIFALAADEEIAESVEESMRQVFEQRKIESQSWVSSISEQGAHVL
jgi:homoserine kinase